LSTKGGPSLDWVVHEATRTTTPLPTLSIGISAGDGADESVRYNHSWRGVDQPNLVILDTVELFQTIFGGQSLAPTSASTDPAAARRARRRVSVLDAVLADYRHVVSDAGGYSPNVRSLIAHHLETVRELEIRALAIQMSFDHPSPKPACASAAVPPPQMHAYLGPAVGDLLPKTTPYFDEMWSVMVDLYLLAMRCDLVRFGNLLVISGGDSYPYTSSNGHADSIHGDGYHRWGDPAVQPLVADNIQWQMSKIAEFLGKLDDPSYKDVDGGSLLDNTTVVIGTELGDDVANHGLVDMPFWIAGRRRFQPGNFVIPGGRSDVDLYNTVLRPIGVDSVFGDPAYFTDLLPILA
jgi:hypothetical protein